MKLIDTHLYLNSSKCHPNRYRKSIPNSQALCLNRICSNNAFFDQRCNKLVSNVRRNFQACQFIVNTDTFSPITMKVETFSNLQ